MEGRKGRARDCPPTLSVDIIAEHNLRSNVSKPPHALPFPETERQRPHPWLPPRPPGDKGPSALQPGRPSGAAAPKLLSAL
eukprot:12658443-Heterocapsa_arctica.AAC.1